MPELAANFWDERYRNRQTGWDIGYASPALVDFTAGWPRKDGPVLIPGCGNAHEAAALLEQGFANITLLDISPFLTASIRDRFSGTGLQVVTGDFFEHTGSYALILEQTFFCALDPLLRPAYVAHMHQLLHPGGILAGLLFNRDFEGGPPFGGNEDEYRRLFAPYFELKKMELCTNSIPPRAGSELFFVAQKSAASHLP